MDELYDVKYYYSQYMEEEFGEALSVDNIDINEPLDLAYTEDDDGVPVEATLHVTEKIIVIKKDNKIVDSLKYKDYAELALELRYLTFADLVSDYLE